MRKVLRLRFGLPLVILGMLIVSAAGPGQDTNNPASSAAPAPPPQSPPIPVIKATTRMVTVQVLVRDKKGQPVPGINENEFQVFEQVPPKKDQRPQKIAAFQFVSVAAIAGADKGLVQM